MALIQNVKKQFETITGYRRPSPSGITVRPRKANAIMFRDDGETPNNPRFPFLYYRSPVVLNPEHDPAAIFEVLFESHGWTDSWRDGIYDFLHFHTQTHEVLGIARGTVKAQFGGRHGRTLTLKAGDVVVHPAGTGHRRIAKSADLLVVGAYPKGGGEYDEPKPGDMPIKEARARIRAVKPPRQDPVYGPKGPLIAAWKASH